ncbi:MAG: hypothetical protein PF482_02965, partial [Desulfobacteraceae bacterium]|nr:hypothetical protein [Desulfobacteraceae bacterium]
MIQFIKCNLELIIAVIALIVAYAAVRNQIIVLILSQFHEKAKEANAYLNEDLAVTNHFNQVSGILSS